MSQTNYGEKKCVVSIVILLRSALLVFNYIQFTSNNVKGISVTWKKNKSFVFFYNNDYMQSKNKLKRHTTERWLQDSP